VPELVPPLLRAELLLLEPQPPMVANALSARAAEQKPTSLTERIFDIPSTSDEPLLYPESAAVARLARVRERAESDDRERK
jgi:hypothetical protein